MPIDHSKDETLSEKGTISDDVEYWQMRAEQELELAQKASKPEAVAAHCQIANAYLERVAMCAPEKGLASPSIADATGET
ncbi:hypothetical protein GCM10011380_36160 [Sphingomonas metalli]|uniref:Uncharacterized protein n=1 Tax=Sphingomonas metalli TaxID=1779358 RepID=A0A916TFU1_9SPHN|nr:hypothetical protein [Sphingomonas metalli]GGB43476.1 hypothetical protein GCM10011380_36160 [Sphingomonas metalli]